MKGVRTLLKQYILSYFQVHKNFIKTGFHAWIDFRAHKIYIEKFGTNLLLILKREEEKETGGEKKKT